MHEPFTYASLGTIAGAATATALVVELIKDINPLKRWPTRWLVVAVSVTITLLGALSNGLLRWDNLLLYFLNGLLVASTAMSGWHLTRDKTNGHSSSAKR